MNAQLSVKHISHHPQEIFLKRWTNFQAPNIYIFVIHATFLCQNKTMSNMSVSCFKISHYNHLSTKPWQAGCWQWQPQDIICHSHYSHWQWRPDFLQSNPRASDQAVSRLSLLPESFPARYSCHFNSRYNGSLNCLDLPCCKAVQWW